MESKAALCPFYVEEDKRTVKCEGLITKVCVHIFKTQDHKKRHKTNYCNACYSQCKHYEEVNKKYI